MNMADVPLFRSVEDALAFAYRHAPAEAPVSSVNGMAGSVPPPGRGLGGLDGAAQAGLILAAVQALGHLPENICRARFMVRSVSCSCGSACCSGRRLNPDWLQAVAIVTAAINHEVPGHKVMYRMRRAVVGRYFGEKIKFTDIAKELRIDRDTASAHANAVQTALRQKESAIRGELFSRLESLLVKE